VGAFIMARETRPKISRPINVLKQDNDAPKRERVLDLDKLLTTEEREKLRQKAADKIAARDKLDAEDQFLEQEMARLEKQNHPEVHEAKDQVVLDLPDYANPIKINGREYWSGRAYTLDVSLVAQLKDVEYQSKRHLRELERGSSLNRYRSRDVRVYPDGGVVAGDGRPVRY
jgi:hypothetical protein